MSETTDQQQTAALAALYTALRDASASQEPTFREKSAEDRAEYKREAKRRDRARAKEAAAAGRPEASREAIREALADAALLLLAVNGPGADEIERALRRAFPGREGVSGTVRMKAMAGTIKPRRLAKKSPAPQAS